MGYSIFKKGPGFKWAGSGSFSILSFFILSLASPFLRSLLLKKRLFYLNTGTFTL